MQVNGTASETLSKQRSETRSKRLRNEGGKVASDMDSFEPSEAASDIYTPLPLPDSSSPSYSPDLASKTSSPGEAERAKRIAAKACHWVRLHPEAWEELKALVQRLCDEGELVQRGALYELARRYDLPVTLSGVYRRDHNLWSALTRFMVMERPSLLSAITFRDTPLDRVDLAAYWRDIVGEDEFVASSLAEARAIWRVQRGAR